MDKRRREQRYRSYLLRLWQTSDGRKQVWRASLESPGGGERRGFAGLRDLFGFLEAQTGCQDNQDCRPDTQGGEGDGTATSF
jgi:hypothetical protein